jgi:hypothetical protein
MNAGVDIAVIGAGAAGIAAAIGAAREGCTTLLLDRREEAGGTGGFSGLTTLCGLYDDNGDFINDGFAREFANAITETAPVRMGRVWVLPYRPEVFRKTARKMLAGTAGLDTRWATGLESVVVEGGRLTRLNGIPVKAVIDCTGMAEVALAAGADCLATTEATQAPAIVFPLCRVTRDISSPASMAQVLLPVARAGFAPLNMQPNLEPESVTVKFSGAGEQVGRLIQFLRERVSGFEDCVTPVSEFPTSHRAARMVKGRHLLTGEDVLQGRRHADAVARCAWPIEQWDSAGVARLRYAPAGTHYEIPARSLQSESIGNLFMAGKTISANEDAIASARVMGCCLATGEAAGRLAARSFKEGRRA